MSEYNLLKDYTAWRLLSAMLLVISIVLGFTHYYLATENKGLKATTDLYEKPLDSQSKGNWEIAFTDRAYTIQNKVHKEYVLTFPYASVGWMKIESHGQSYILYSTEISRLANASFCESIFSPKPEPIIIPTVLPPLPERLDNELEETALILLIATGFGNYTQVYTEKIGNTTFGLAYSTITGSMGELGRIVLFGYGNPTDKTMHLDIYLTDNKGEFIKFFEIHYSTKGSYLEMYPERGGFKRKELP